MIKKVGELIISPVQGGVILGDSLVDRSRKLADLLFNRWGVLLIALGFLLGRAVIIGELSPFAVPFLAVLYHLRKERLMLIAGAAVLGAFTHVAGQPIAILTGMLLFIYIQKVMERWGKGALSYTPFAVFIAVLVSNIAITLFSHQLTNYQLMMTVVEAGLSLILTLIFVQSLPMIANSRRGHSLKNEELVCLVILLASVLTGFAGYLFMGLSAEHVLSRYAILLFALAAGGAVGATVGVVMGIILSLANIESMLQMSLLAFSGLLGGLLREGKKIGVSIGLLIGTVLLGLYSGSDNLWFTLNESLLAIALFLLTPKWVIEKISRFIPGTTEHDKLQHDYARRLRDVTAVKVKQFSGLFHQLSRSFSVQPKLNEDEKARYADLFLSQVTEKTCQVCFKKDRCWNEKFDNTYQYMNELFETLEVYGQFNKPNHLFNKHCHNAEKVRNVMEQEFEHYQTHLVYRKKMLESSRLVADQLSGVSQVMDNFAQEIKKEGENHQVQEQQVLDALEDLGLSIRYVDIVSLEEGNIEIEISQPMCYGRDECVKVIAPLLSEIVGENIITKKKECDFYHDGHCKMTLFSAKAYKIDIGISSAAKGGDLISGDSHQTMEVGNGKYALVISDGMGNGERAHKESMETITLLNQILQSGIEETVAIKSINSVLSLRSTEEVFSTLDLAIIDLQSATTKFLKIGSTPSFIKRGEHCISVSASNLPMGIIQDIEIDVVSENLKAGDLLIMMSDGLYEAPRHVENKAMWMKRMISEISSEDPQEIADLLLEKVVRFHQGKIIDDMTVLVAAINRNTPEWSTISMAGIPKLNQRNRKQNFVS